jgi:hypothetical protein|tara:strand:- start:59 stop:247 length:189 start_codon:yes stop_codon:yes gene_type:complete
MPQSPNALFVCECFARITSGETFESVALGVVFDDACRAGIVSSRVSVTTGVATTHVSPAFRP